MKNIYRSLLPVIAGAMQKELASDQVFEGRERNPEELPA
jgi:hypothetical protein